ncbi:MAG: hypothetical protein ACP5MD_03925 [Verrucomicrobiia bacterium]
MKFLARWTFRLVLLALVVAIALVLLKDLLAREIIESAIAQSTGLECRISHAEVRLLSPTLLLSDLRIYHPPALGGERLVHLSEAFIEYEPAALSRLEIRLRLVRLHITELTIVEQSSGQSTLELLKRVWADIPQRTKSGWIRFAGLDTLNLNVDRATCFRPGTPRPPEHFNLNLRHQVFRNLRTTEDFQTALERTLTPVIMGLATNRPPGSRTRPPQK